MRFCVITIFPGLVQESMKFGLLGRAATEGRITLEVADLRDYTHDRHRTVDDTPFGGGGGMVMRPEPVCEAVEALKRPGEKVILLSPQGATLDHAKVVELSGHPGLVLVCGRYEGIDERVRQAVVDEEISIGDYVLMGGELPALVLMEAVSRQLAGVLGNPDSAENESFVGGVLDCPHYTRPAEFRGMKVPDTLLSGDHGAVDRWRRQEALKRTMERRPDLLDRATLDEEDRNYLDSLKKNTGLPKGRLRENQT